MYKIGQLRKDNSTSYLTDIDYKITTVQTPGLSEAVFNDFAIQANNNFTPNNIYYLRFSVRRIELDDARFKDEGGTGVGINDPRQLTINLELFKDNILPQSKEYARGTYQIIKSNIAVEAHTPKSEKIKTNNKYFTYEIAFVPNASYPYLGFILNRTRYDYLDAPRNIRRKQAGDIYSADDVEIDLNEKGDLSIVNNILPRSSVDKIGIQTRPGSLVCVNQEPIRIGRTGTWELNNGIPISFVGFAAPNGSDNKNIDNFILDYSWDEK